MISNLKSRSFIFVYWGVLLVLILDRADTIYRTVSAYYNGVWFGGLTKTIGLTSEDLFFFILSEFVVFYGIYLFYKLKKSGGYWFLGANAAFFFYALFFGPISNYGFLEILPSFIFYFVGYFVLVVFVPLYYFERFV